MSCFPPRPYHRRGEETSQRYKLFLCFTILCQKIVGEGGIGKRLGIKIIRHSMSFSVERIE